MQISLLLCWICVIYISCELYLVSRTVYWLYMVVW